MAPSRGEELRPGYAASGLPSREEGKQTPPRRPAVWVPGWRGPRQRAPAPLGRRQRRWPQPGRGALGRRPAGLAMAWQLSVQEVPGAGAPDSPPCA